MSNVVNFPRRPPPPPPPNDGGALSAHDRLQALMAAVINDECAASCPTKAAPLRMVFEQNARLFRYFAEVKAHGSQR